MSAPPIVSDDGEQALNHSDFPHLTVFEWEALRRLTDVSGITTVAAMLSAASAVQQRTAVHEFLARELADSRRRASTPALPKNDAVKLDVSSYNGEGPHRLALNRWLCEVDIAIQARQLSTELAKKHFLLSKLTGRAKEWALGRLVADPTCFPTTDALKDDLRLAFEPPQDETQHRAAFLTLRQGRLSMRDYIQRARHLVSCVVKSPIDMVTLVHVFTAGMNAGHQRFYLTRKPPASLEEAFAVALREDFSVMAARGPRAQEQRAETEPEPMEVDTIEHTTQGRGVGNTRPRPATNKQIKCFRCGKIGHRAAVCRAPAPVLAAVDTSGDQLDDEPRPKNAGRDCNATTSSSDKRLIVLSLHVAGAKRTLRALLDSGATNNFVNARSLRVLPPRVQPRESPGGMVVKFADGEPRTVPRRSVSFSYEFDGFESRDEFLVIELNGSFDCIFGMPWLARHRPDVDWLNRTVKPRDIGVGVVLAVLQGRASKWSHVAVVDPDSATALARGESDGPPFVACENATCTLSAEQRLPTANEKTAPEQWLTVRSGRAVVPAKRASSVEQRFLTSKSSRGGRAMVPARPSSQAVASATAPRCALAARAMISARREPSVERSRQHECASGASVARSKKQSVRTNRAKGEKRGVRGSRDAALEVSHAAPCEPVAVSRGNDRHPTRVVDAAPRGNSPQATTSAWQCDPPPVFESVSVVNLTGSGPPRHTLKVASPPHDAHEITRLPEMGRDERFAAQSWEQLEASDNPVLALAREFADVFPDKIPPVLPVDRGVRHEIDLLPGSKHCVTRQWPLPRDQVEAIDAFFEGRRAAGHVRESTSPHSSPTFCVKKVTGGWRIVHAFNKLNDATIPAQTPIPCKDMVLDSMSGSTVFSTIDLTDGFYQILMRESDVPLTAVSTPSGMLWEWLVMPQGLKNAPATRASESATDIETHLGHLRKVFEAMHEHKLYANLKKCIFCAPEIPVLGSYVSAAGVRADPEKVASIVAWPAPRDPKELRQWLGLANYLHHYAKDFAATIYPLSQLLKKDSAWRWLDEHQAAFELIKERLSTAPVLALVDHTKPFHVVCDASDFAIGCALMQHDADGKERVISYQSRQLKSAERNYPVHDKELLAMRYALVKFRVYLLGEQTFALYTDHASLRTATKSPHLSQRMARWLSLFAEYNFVVFYKPGSTNIITDALSRRSDYDPRPHNTPAADVDDDEEEECAACVALGLNATEVTAVSPLKDVISAAYDRDPFYSAIVVYCSAPSESALSKLSPKIRACAARYALVDGLLSYRIDQHDCPRVVVPADDDLRARILHEFHDSATGGHLGREKTYLALAREYYWPHMYKWLRKWVRSCEICQRVKPASSSQAPLQPLPVAEDAWRSVSMDFVFGLPSDASSRTGILVFVDRFSKMTHLAAVSASVTAEEAASLFIDTVFRHHGMPESIVSDRDPRFTAAFWSRLFQFLGTRLLMSTSAHPETDGQTERVNRVVEDVLRSYAMSYESWSSFLPMAEFAANNAVHASTGMTPFYVNHARHPRVPASLGIGGRESDGRETPSKSSSSAAPASAPTRDAVQRTDSPPLDELGRAEQGRPRRAGRGADNTADRRRRRDGSGRRCERRGAMGKR